MLGITFVVHDMCHMVGYFRSGRRPEECGSAKQAPKELVLKEIN
jgi:hypothetical protein